MPQHLTGTEIRIRKQTLESDLENVKENITKLDNEKLNLVAQHHAISGAIQQCDLFMNELETVVSETTDSSIPKSKKG